MNNSTSSTDYVTSDIFNSPLSSLSDNLTTNFTSSNSDLNSLM